jgi:hypothetical protein
VPQNSGTDKDLYGLHVADERAGWAVGEGGTILATRDGGTTWAPRTTGTKKTLDGVHFTNSQVADPHAGWAVGEGGTILATRDGGTTWALQKSGTDENLLSVHFADPRTGWAVGGGGTILATRDGGTHWEPQARGTEADLWGAYFANAQTGWVVGRRGTILATQDGGTHWERQKRGTDDLYSVHFAGAQTGWAVGDSGTMPHSGSPIYAPLVVDEDTKVNSKGLDEVDVSFRVKPDDSQEVRAARVSARVGEGGWALLGNATKSEAGDGGRQLWHLTWKPQTIARSGDDIEYQVQLDDGGPPLVGYFTWQIHL